MVVSKVRASLLTTSSSTMRMGLSRTSYKLWQIASVTCSLVLPKQLASSPRRIMLTSHVSVVDAICTNCWMVSEAVPLTKRRLGKMPPNTGGMDRPGVPWRISCFICNLCFVSFLYCYIFCTALHTHAKSLSVFYPAALFCYFRYWMIRV